MKLVLFFALGVGMLAQPPAKKAARVVQGGVKTPGIALDGAALKPDAAIAVPGLSGAVLQARNTLFAPQRGQNAVLRLDAKTNQAAKPVEVGEPCGDPVSAFGAVWVGSCSGKAVTQLDMAAGKVKTATPLELGLSAYTLTATADSLWVISDAKTTLSRVDPQTGEIVAEVRLPAGCGPLIAAESALWAGCAQSNKVVRVEPKTNLVDKQIEVKGAGSLAAGAGSVWVWSKTEGKLARIDPKTNKITATIDLGLPGVDASVDFGGGFVWVSAPGFPISRISPETSPEGGKLLQQFRGEGAGLIRFALDSLWISDLQAGLVRRYDPKRVAAMLAD